MGIESQSLARNVKPTRALWLALNLVCRGKSLSRVTQMPKLSGDQQCPQEASGDGRG